MAEVDVSVTIKISIPDTDKLRERIKEEYEEVTVTDETILEFIEDNIEAHNTCGGLFLVEGSSADTTGCLINEISLDELTEKMDSE